MRIILVTAVLCLAILLLALSGCVGAYRLQHPLGPVKGDRLPICDVYKKNCAPA
jgi:hypothetical protein